MTSKPMRKMYDSDNLDDIPADAEIVAFYNDGEPGTATPEQLQRFSGKVLVPITRKVGVVAKVADIEPGCIWPPSEAVVQFQNGDSDTAYYNESDRGEVEAVLNSAGVKYYKWVAAYPGNGENLLQPGDSAHQYADPESGSGGHFDLSVVSDSWPVPVEQAPNTPVEGESVSTVHTDYNDEPLEDAKDSVQLQAPVVDAVQITGGRYLVAADGGVFCFGDAKYYGSIPDLIKEGKMGPLQAAVCTIIAVDNRGYTLITQDGGEFVFGAGVSEGSL